MNTHHHVGLQQRIVHLSYLLQLVSHYDNSSHPKSIAKLLRNFCCIVVTHLLFAVTNMLFFRDAVMFVTFLVAMMISRIAFRVAIFYSGDLLQTT